MHLITVSSSLSLTIFAFLTLMLTWSRIKSSELAGTKRLAFAISLMLLTQLGLMISLFFVSETVYKTFILVSALITLLSALLTLVISVQTTSVKENKNPGAHALSIVSVILLLILLIVLVVAFFIDKNDDSQLYDIYSDQSIRDREKILEAMKN